MILQQTAVTGVPVIATKANLPRLDGRTIMTGTQRNVMPITMQLLIGQRGQEGHLTSQIDDNAETIGDGTKTVTKETDSLWRGLMQRQNASARRRIHSACNAGTHGPGIASQIWKPSAMPHPDNGHASESRWFPRPRQPGGGQGVLALCGNGLDRMADRGDRSLAAFAAKTL